MQATLLIVDSIATNRVALKVKLASAWYDVSTAATGAEALERTADLVPNLVIVNNALPDMHVAEFSARLKSMFAQSAPPLLALTEQHGAREPLLRSGAEDVLTMPVDDQFLLARIRSVLRSSASEAEWRLRDGTTRALGFAEPRQLFDRPVPVVYLCDTRTADSPELAALQQERQLDLRSLLFRSALCNIEKTEGASVLIIQLPQEQPETALSLLSDLRANARTRHKAILVIAPHGRSDLAARALDLGADEATIGAMPTSELTLRARRMHKRRKINDSLRAMVKNGAEASIRDPLTGLYNRRYAMPHLERMAEQSHLASQPYAVMIADLDHFKQINDWHGHDAGDAVLQECARRLQRNMRAIDLVARIGGEEFLVVLPTTGRSAARQAALRLCERISEQPVIVPKSGVSIDVTISVGLAISHPVDPMGQSSSFRRSLIDTPDVMLARADRALYRAKENGRNRFSLERSAA